MTKVLQVNRRTAAEYLGVSVSYLDKARVYGGGPAYRKLGRRVLYSLAELERWAAERELANTSEDAA